MDLFDDDVQDMSVTGDGAWQTVTLLVGREGRAFEAHLQRLGPLVEQLDIQPGNDVKVPDWDPDVFNLVMNWTYNDRLPRVLVWNKYFSMSSQPLPLPVSVPRPPVALFTPAIEAEGDGSRSHFMTIATHPQYKEYSIEELRFHFMKVDERDEVERSIFTAQQAGDPFTRRCPSIPSHIPLNEAVKADKAQILLLKLMIFAETFKWEALFNEAIDAFRHGETQLHRTYTPTSQTNLLFSVPQATPAVQRFIVDYALHLGRKHNSMSQYRDLMLSQPDILSSMLANMDKKTPSASMQNFGINPDSVPDTSDPVNIAYHLHNGALIVDCNCFLESSFGFPGIN
ncbi:hypothetical protein SAMD00023353_2201100 [Rosellinia necatrix]|uniref:BTB domain-containing protein n=1 Tax=Rosellinia necatrix TaxID=77044 RepID=A0A1S7UUU9_ROSNE|nr:hypothetical protein SAMD00023353_2201100 [Rosellinia necatrix]